MRAFLSASFTCSSPVSTLGSTSTGAIDNIAQVTAVAASYPELFIHVE